MRKQRKEIIISEIRYWKQNKLLPEHYCDFLIALYSRGEEIDNKEASTFKSILDKENKKLLRTIMFLLILVCGCAVSLYVFVNDSTLVLGLSAIAFLSLLIYAMSPIAKKSGAVPFIYIASAFLLLAMSLKLWIVYLEGQTLLLIGLLLVNCTLWLIMGKRLNLIYFMISGVVGIVLIIGFLLAQF